MRSFIHRANSAASHSCAQKYARKNSVREREGRPRPPADSSVGFHTGAISGGSTRLNSILRHRLQLLRCTAVRSLYTCVCVCRARECAARRRLLTAVMPANYDRKNSFSLSFSLLRCSGGIYARSACALVSADDALYVFFSLSLSLFSFIYILCPAERIYLFLMRLFVRNRRGICNAK